MNRQKGLNKYQKAAFRPGEKRTRHPEIAALLALAESEDATERCHAAQNLCPCHVRRRIDAVWVALYRLMEDPDVAVRRAAWHTLEDGGRPDDPAFLPILARTLTHETDPQVRRFAQLFAAEQRIQESIAEQRGRAPRFNLRGRCDFCGAQGSAVRRDFDTEINAVGQQPRHALICARCEDRSASPVGFA